MMGGGIRCGLLTELVGEATAGKTQTCLQLLLSVQWPKSRGGLEGSALYMYTEGDPPMRRLEELAAVRPKMYCGTGEAFDNIYVERDIATWEDLDERLRRMEHFIQNPPGPPLRLVVIDSIAHLFSDNVDFQTGGYAERTARLFRVAGLLKRYADEYKLAVVVTNQVRDVIREGAVTASAPHTAGLRLMSSGREVMPALGPSWASCVDVRLFLSRSEIHDTTAPMNPNLMPGQRQLDMYPHRRCMQVVYSPCSPQCYTYYIVSQQGIQGVHQDYPLHGGPAKGHAAAPAQPRPSSMQTEPSGAGGPHAGPHTEQRLAQRPPGGLSVPAAAGGLRSGQHIQHQPAQRPPGGQAQCGSSSAVDQQAFGRQQHVAGVQQAHGPPFGVSTNKSKADTTGQQRLPPQRQSDDTSWRRVTYGKQPGGQAADARSGQPAQPHTATGNQQVHGAGQPAAGIHQSDAGPQNSSARQYGSSMPGQLERGQWSESAAEGQMPQLQPSQRLTLREKMQQRREQGDTERHKLARTDDDQRPSEYHGRAC